MSAHYCKGELPSSAYGPAVTECWEAPRHNQHLDPWMFPPGSFWVSSDGEYWSAVDYCPYCGTKASIPVKEIPR